ncbi:hypothetical protein PPYR_05017 [Photinus pyralis]|uniref:Uncharacterized protein n=1 Tax=Photinus pyralis TaxID=7054 RepID=A0A5N4AZP4_PHOPY|nr:hypothetical protein PPYR_05017 [Photinus pyralis]
MGGVVPLVSVDFEVFGRVQGTVWLLLSSVCNVYIQQGYTLRSTVENLQNNWVLLDGLKTLERVQLLVLRKDINPILKQCKCQVINRHLAYFQIEVFVNSAGSTNVSVSGLTGCPISDPPVVK